LAALTNKLFEKLQKNIFIILHNCPPLIRHLGSLKKKGLPQAVAF